MAHPPKDLSAQELFSKLTECPRPSEVVDWPRSEMDSSGRSIPVARVRIRVLTMRDHDEARLVAHMWLKNERRIPSEDMSAMSVREVYGDACAREVLSRAIVTEHPIPGTESSPVYGRIFLTGKALESVTADELTTLFQAYQLIQERYGPYNKNLASEGEVSAWIKRLVEGAEISPLAQASSLQLAELNMSLAQRAYTLSQILESLQPSLDESLGASLLSLDIGTGFFSSPASRSTEKPLTEIVDRLNSVPGNPLFDDEITIEKAAALARRRGGLND